MRSISYLTLNRLTRFFLSLRNQERELLVEMRNLLKDVSLGNKVTTLVAQRDFLNRLIKMKEATPEIVKLASDVMRNSERSRLWERRIMNQRRFLKENENVETRKQWQMASRLVESRLPAHKVTEY